MGASEETGIHSFPKVYNLGHRAIDGIFDHPVTVEEKLDGSQFSFALIGGDLRMRSKGAVVRPETAGMFDLAVQSVSERRDDLKDGWIYRAEYLSKPKHNTLTYDSVPDGNLAVFDIETGEQHFLSHDEKVEEARRLGLGSVPLLHEGEVGSFDDLMAFMDRESILGGPTIEGLVVKNYELFTADKKVAMGKHVSEGFKEKHSKDWRKRNPTRGDVVERLIKDYATEARWRKAVQHLRERGGLQEAPQDIGPLMKEVAQDIHEEDRDEIAGVLFDHFWKQISRGVTRGLPEWYKAELAKGAFE